MRPRMCLSEEREGGGGASSLVVINKGPWTEAEDKILSAYIKAHGEGNWRLIPQLAGLSRCGKSCRLRWINYLRPDVKRGNFSPDEDNLILTLHALLGSRWSLIAGRIPGRTDNDIKNYWNTHLKRKLRSMGVDPMSYKVGLPLLPDEEDHRLKRPKVMSGPSDHHTPTAHKVSSPETSFSESYGSRCTSGSELESSSMSLGEGVLPYPEAPPGISTSTSRPSARSEASVGLSELVDNVELGASSESFSLHCHAAENFYSLAGESGSCGSDLQLPHQAAAELNVELLDCFESGLLPLESHLQDDVPSSTPWASFCLFDSLL